MLLPNLHRTLTKICLSSIVLSIFAIAILGVLALLFNANHHSMMSSTDDPVDGHVVAKNCLGAIAVYGVRIGAVLFAHAVYMKVMGGKKKVEKDKQIINEDGREVVYEGEAGIALQGGEVVKG